ncbi:MAG: hypothetical protein FWF01_04760 [Alphaproteobacteria bacterium]|nr:hypothetical protein [Alphaproteobacteria bacterium]
MAKIKAAQEINDSHRLILIYGADEGQVQEILAGVLAREGLAVTKTSAKDVRDSPGIFFDTVGSNSLFGGRGCIVVSDGDGHLVKTADEFLNSTANGLAVITASALGPDSSLRKLAETHESCAALACYADDERALSRLIADTLRAGGKRAAPDALEYLASHLGADRMVTKSELQKLLVYMGDDQTLTADMARNVVGDSGAASLDKLNAAAFGQDAAGAVTAMERLLSSGEYNAVALVRIMLNHLEKLAFLADGGAIESMRPKPNFRVADVLRSQARLWPGSRVIWAIQLLLDAELQVKKLGSEVPENVLLGRALLQLATHKG